MAKNEILLAVLEDEYPEVKKLSKPILRALLDGQQIREVRPAGTHIDFNQDWPTIIETAKNFIEAISGVLGIISAWKGLPHEQEDRQEQLVFDRFKSSKEGEKSTRVLGDAKVRNVVKRALKKR